MLHVRVHDLSAPTTNPIRLTRAQTAALSLGAVAISLVPVLTVRFLPLVDYPFHFARVFLIANRHDPFLQDLYAVQSLFIPNIALDAFAAAATRVMSPDAAMTTFVALTFCAIMAGVAILHFSFFRYLTPWPLIVACLLLYNFVFVFGFLNYLLALGLMLCLLGVWILAEPLPTYARIAIGAASAMVLYFAHLIAFGLYGVAIAAYGIHRSFEGGRPRVRKLVGTAMITATPFILPLAMHFAVSPTSADLAGGLHFQPLTAKLTSLLFTPTVANPWVDLALAGWFVLVVASLALGTVRLAPSSLAVVAGLVAAFLLLPTSTMEGGHLDDRIPLAFLLVLAAGCSISYRARRVCTAVLAMSVLMIAVRLGAVTREWNRWDRQYARYAELDLEPGSLLLVATEPRPEREIPYQWMRPPLRHAPELAIRDSVFIPAIWASPALQPLVVTSRYEPVYEFQANDPIVVADDQALGSLVRGARDVSAPLSASLPNVYLLLLRTGHRLAADLTVVESSEDYVLWRLTP